MIEGCIVAKLVFGYLKEEGFSRTCSTFQEECSYFHNGNREIDMVLLTADLKTILDDYSRPKEAGRENVSSSSAVIKSLWKELDILIGQLKYATIPVAPRSSLSSQSARTRKLNYVSRPWKNTAPTSKELAFQTTSSAPVTQQQFSPVLHGKNVAEKLPLPRLSSGGRSHTQLLHLHQSQVADPHLFTSTSLAAVALQPIFAQSNTSGRGHLTEMSTSHRTGQMAGCNLTFSTLPAFSQKDQAWSTSNTSNLRIAVSNENPDSSNSGNQVQNNAALECAVKVTDYRSDTSNKGGSDIIHGAESGTCNGPERSKIASVVSVGELSPSRCNASQDESHLKSPKRKCVQPKKRTVQGDAILLSLGDSPVKSVTCSSSSATQDVEFLENPSWDVTSTQYFVDKLLNTPLLQEKLAENINKVVGSSRQQPYIEEEEKGSRSIMIGEVTSGNSVVASSESCGADIPVEDIMEQMQTDPAFDTLFSMFGLDILGDSALSKESPTDAVADGVSTSTLPGPVEASNSLSTASNLHSSATSIVTDALLLLAGSPQKPPQPILHQSGLPSGVPHSENARSVSPPLQRQAANDTSTDRRSATKPSNSLTHAIMTSLPYVRALDFSVGKDDISTTDTETVKIMGRRKGTKNKKSTKRRPLKDSSTEQIQSQHRAPASQTHNRVSFSTINMEGSVACSSDAKFSRVVNQTSQSTGTRSCLANVYTTLTPLSSYASVTPPSLPSVNPSTVGAASDTNMTVTSPVNFANLDFLTLPSIGPTPSPCTVTGPGTSTFMHNSASLMPSSACATSHVSCPTASPVDSNVQSKSACVHQTSCPKSFNLIHKGTNSNHSPITSISQYTCPPYSLDHLTKAYTSATSLTSAASCHPHTTCPSVANLNYVGMNPPLLASHSAEPSLMSSGTYPVTAHGFSPVVSVGLPPLVGSSNTLTLSSSSSSMLETRDMFTEEPWSSKMLSTEALKASNMLHTLALSRANSQRCSSGDAGQLMTANVQGCPVLLPEYHKSKELWTSRESSNICKDKTEALNVAPARMDNACEKSVVSWDVLDTSHNQKRNASKSITRDQECRVVMDKNSKGFTQIRSDVDREEPSGRRQRNLSSQHKVKRSKGSRVVKKFKSKEDSIHFPKNLNVEEFLSKLCYEEK